jgi:hypothetical protein
MKWVTRARPKVDRIACPWLIKRFVDGEAEFLYVSPDKVVETAKQEGATLLMCQTSSLATMGLSAALMQL